MGREIAGYDDRWGAAGSFAKWLHLKLTQAGIKPKTPLVYRNKATGKQYAMDVETVISVILDASNDPKYEQAIYDLLKAGERKGKQLMTIIEQMGAKLVETGFFERDPKSRIRNFPLN